MLRRKGTQGTRGSQCTRVRGARGTRESPVLTRSTKIVPLSFEPGSSATNLRAAERVLQSTPQYPHSTRTVPAQYPHSTPAAARRAGVVAHAHTDTHLRTQAHTSTHARATFVRARRGFAPARDVLVLRGYSKGYCGGTQGVLWGYSRGILLQARHRAGRTCARCADAWTST